jgi:hypothetical protein
MKASGRQDAAVHVHEEWEEREGRDEREYRKPRRSDRDIHHPESSITTHKATPHPTRDGVPEYPPSSFTQLSLFSP